MPKIKINGEKANNNIAPTVLPKGPNSINLSYILPKKPLKSSIIVFKDSIFLYSITKIAIIAAIPIITKPIGLANHAAF